LIFCHNNVFNHSLHMRALILMGHIKVYPSLYDHSFTTWVYTYVG
jgi:hypothetical protein